MNLSPSELEDFFHTLCDAAAQETLPRFRAPIDVTNKLDDGFDPVTKADQQAELAIRNLIEANFPDHGIIGEEHGVVRQDAEWQWILDPVDGTRAFISGLPVWGTLIGLNKGGKAFAGVMDQPFTGERYMAINGASHLHHSHSPKPVELSTSKTKLLNDSILMTTSPHLFTPELLSDYGRLESSVKLVRYGCDCYAYCMLASGHVDLVAEHGLNSYDIAALVPIIENAGGFVTNWQGGPIVDGGSILAAANSKILQQAVKMLNS